MKSNPISLYGDIFFFQMFCFFFVWDYFKHFFVSDCYHFFWVFKWSFKPHEIQHLLLLIFSSKNWISIVFEFRILKDERFFYSLYDRKTFFFYKWRLGPIANYIHFTVYKKLACITPSTSKIRAKIRSSHGHLPPFLHRWRDACSFTHITSASVCKTCT